MTQTEIYRYVNALWNADDMGGLLNLKEYNDAQKEVNLTMFNDAIAELSASMRGPMPELILSSKMLRPFVTESAALTPTAGTIALNTQLTSYAFLLKVRTSAAYQGSIREIPLVDHADLANRMSNLMREPLKYHPVCTIDGNNLKIKPTDVTPVIIDYLAFPTTPIFDYYIDANDNVVPMAVAATHALVAGETYSDGTTTGTKTSTTIELEWGSEYHFQYINLLLKRLGLANNDQLHLQTAMAEEQTLAMK
jgi:hypothetical protein